MATLLSARIGNIHQSSGDQLNSNGSAKIHDHIGYSASGHSPVHLTETPIVEPYNHGNIKIDAQYSTNYDGFTEEPLFGQPISRSYLQKTLLSIQSVASHMEKLDNYHEVGLKSPLSCLIVYLIRSRRTGSTWP